MDPVVCHPRSDALRYGAARRRIPALLILACGMLLLSGSSVIAQDDGPSVAMLHVDGTITPVMATYIGRGIDRAAKRGDTAVILEMDTPGGLSSAMDDIISDILKSPIPVIVYVAPDGARAASAGMYITYAAHVAAMAPTTNIGSATPIDLGSADSDPSQLSAHEKKVINDAVAKVQALAELRGRNASWAEQAVREADNITASRAVELGVVDFIAASRDDLLAQSDGRTVSLQGRQTTVHTAGARVYEINMSFFERLLQVVSDPNIAFVLISLGTLALVFELSNPGLILPGVAGGLMMVLGFYSLGTIDTNWAGLALLAFAFLLFATDAFVPTHGFLTVGGIISFLVGALLLANTRDDNVQQLSRVVIFTVTVLLGAFFLFVVGAIARTRHLPPSTGASSIVGMIGIARTDIDPRGMVFLNGELWDATTTAGSIAAGTRVRVSAMHGIRLIVVPAAVEGGIAQVDPAAPA